MTEKDFIPVYGRDVNSGSVTWKSPSNIALVKYWGKRENQVPANPSLSLTLDTCATTTQLKFKKLKNPVKDFSFELFFEGKEKDDFKPKISEFFKRVEKYLLFLKDYHFNIHTSNSFPHSSGIASSASGMSALALCLMSIEKELNPLITDAYFYQKASFLARLGSGSACRSIEGGFIEWGNHGEIEGSSDLYAIKYPFKVHAVFENYNDTILLVDKGEKQVSSTAGHSLMYGHSFAEKRFEQASQNLSKLRKILEEGNLDGFIQIVECEALTLHAMMMTSVPYFILMKPNTLEIINRIWNFRKETGLHVCFTLDAGANVHVLYPENEQAEILEFIKNELITFCENGHYICDRIGFGAKEIKIIMNN